MKSNISKKEIESGQKIIEKLSQLNPKLLPHLLKEVISGYKKFVPHISKYGLWSSVRTKNKKFKQKYDKIMLLYSGVSAGGKDTIYQEMKKIYPNLFSQAITGTSRPPREGELHGQDHYFFDSSKSFKEAIKNKEFLEYIKRGTTFYGLPKKSLDDAIKKPTPIIYSQIEMSGWSKAEKYISKINDKVLIVKIFIMPDMTFSEYKNWIIEKRIDNDPDSRLIKTGWELKKAPKKTDFIITNRISKKNDSVILTAKTIINQLLDLLNNSQFEKFNSPFDNYKKTSDIKEIIKTHDSVK